MQREFTVTMTCATVAGKKVKFVGNVLSVPGVDVFETAREVAAAKLKRQKKGQIARVLRAFMVAA